MARRQDVRMMNKIDSDIKLQEYLAGILKENKELKKFILELKTPSNNRLITQFTNNKGGYALLKYSNKQLAGMNKDKLIRLYKCMRLFLKRRDKLLINKLAELRIATRQLELIQAKLTHYEKKHDKRTYQNLKVNSNGKE